MEDLCALPRPLEPAPRDSRQPSRAEQIFAGLYLNLAGLTLLLAGLLSFMKRSGMTGGYLQCLTGLAVGLGMTLAGDRLYRQAMRQYAQVMLAGGLSLLLMTTCAAHFYYRLIGPETLFVALVAVVAGSGVAVYRYDSRALGNVMLAVLFLAPFLMTFSFARFSVIFAYLVAVNVGVTLVSFYKRWDFQLLACLVGSYALYFHFFSRALPEHSMLFLGVIYGLFLVSNNLLHFWRSSSSEFNLGLSYVNPTIFAVVSYCVLEQMSNLVPVAVYLALGAVHLALARAARRRLSQDPKFSDIATNNLVMGLLFVVASVSFVNHFYDMHDTKSYIAQATVLWFGLALGLLQFPGRIARRYSTACLVLTVFQQLTVIPWMLEGPGRLGLQVGSAVLYLVYFLRLRSRAETAEDLRVMQSSVVAGLAVLVWLGLGTVHPVVVLAWLSLVTGGLGRLFPAELGALRWLAPLSGTLLISLALTTPYDLKALLLSALLLGAQAVLTRADREQAALSATLAGGLLLWIAAWEGVLVYLGGAGLAAGLVLWVRTFPLGLLVCLLAGSLTGWCLAWPTLPWEPTLLVAALEGLAALALRGEWGRRVGSLALLTLARPLFLGGPVALALVSLGARRGGLRWAAEALAVAAALTSGGGYAPLVVLVLAMGDRSLWGMALTSAVLCYQAQDPVMLSLAGAQVLAWSFLEERVCVGAGCLTLAYLLSGSFPVPVCLAVAAGTYLAWRRLPCHPVLLGLALAAAMKALVGFGQFTTLSWALLALAGLRWQPRGHQAYVTALFLVFLKSTAWDAGMSSVWGTLGVPEVVAGAGVVACLMTGARLAPQQDQRTLLTLLGLVTFAFQANLLLFNVYGILESFQVILSGFWCLTGVLFVAFGLQGRAPVPRIFGLAIEVAAALKIVVVDLWVLQPADQTPTMITLGALLMATAYLYQRFRDEPALVPA